MIKDKKILKRISGEKEKMQTEAQNQVAMILLDALDELKKDILTDLLDYQEQYKKKEISGIRCAIIEWQAQNFLNIINYWTEVIDKKKNSKEWLPKKSRGIDK